MGYNKKSRTKLGRSRDRKTTSQEKHEIAYRKRKRKRRSCSLPLSEAMLLAGKR
jgi:hypothetical protein